MFKKSFNCNIEEGVITIIRFVLCSRKYLECNNEMYCEKCNILDDYKFYLNFIDNVLNKDVNGCVINSDHIYLYNNMNDSVSIKNKEKYNEDYKIPKGYYDEYRDLDRKLGVEWNLEFIKYINLDEPFDKIKMTKNEDNTYNICKNSLRKIRIICIVWSLQIIYV